MIMCNIATPRSLSSINSRDQRPVNRNVRRKMKGSWLWTKGFYESKMRDGTRAESEENSGFATNDDEIILTETSIEHLLQADNWGSIQEEAKRNEMQLMRVDKTSSRIGDEAESDIEGHTDGGMFANQTSQSNALDRSTQATFSKSDEVTALIEDIATISDIMKLQEDELYSQIEKRFKIIRSTYNTALHARRSGDREGAAILMQGARSLTKAVTGIIEVSAEVDKNILLRLLAKRQNMYHHLVQDILEGEKKLQAEEMTVDQWLPEPSADNVHTSTTCKYVDEDRTHRIMDALSEEKTKDSNMLLQSNQTEDAGQNMTYLSQMERTIDLHVQAVGRTGCRIDASVKVETPPQLVYDILIDYERLGDFIPGLAQNEVLQRRSNGCKLLQVGLQRLALGIKLRVETVIEVFELPEGLEMVNDIVLQSKDEAVTYNAREWIQPKDSDAGMSCMDICFIMTESKELKEFVGTWRVQKNERGMTTLSYVVRVEPRPWLPTALVESRIAKEVQENLEAVRSFAEDKCRNGILL